MTPETRAKAKEAYAKMAEIYNLLGDLSKELTSREDFAGYLMVQDVWHGLQNEDTLTRLGAVSTMGEKEKP